MPDYTYQTLYFTEDFKDEVEQFKKLIQLDKRVIAIAKKHKARLFSAGIKMLISVYNKSNKEKILNQKEVQKDGDSSTTDSVQEDSSSN